MIEGELRRLAVLLIENRHRFIHPPVPGAKGLENTRFFTVPKVVLRTPTSDHLLDHVDCRRLRRALDLELPEELELADLRACLLAVLLVVLLGAGARRPVVRRRREHLQDCREAGSLLELAPSLVMASCGASRVALLELAADVSQRFAFSPKHGPHLRRLLGAFAHRPGETPVLLQRPLAPWEHGTIMLVVFFNLLFLLRHALEVSAIITRNFGSNDLFI